MSEHNTDWMTDLFAALDRDGVPGMFPWLDEQLRFRFAGYPAGTGRQNFADVWAAMSPGIRSLRHSIRQAWQIDDDAICHGEVTYELTSGRRVTVPFANVFRLRAGLITEYLIYVDASAVFGAHQPDEA